MTRRRHGAAVMAHGVRFLGPPADLSRPGPGSGVRIEWPAFYGGEAVPNAFSGGVRVSPSHLRQSACESFRIPSLKVTEPHN